MSRNRKGSSSLFILFIVHEFGDNAGMDNYLRDVYGREVDDIVGIIREGRVDNEPPEYMLEKMANLLNM